MSSAVKVALVGISGYGDSYVAAMLRAAADGKCQLVGAVDPMPQRSRRLEELKTAGVALHPDLPSLYSVTHPDLVMLVTPIHLHSAQTCWCLERGSNVLCEKPLAGSVKDARRMVVAEQLSERFISIGYQWSFAKSTQQLKRDILAGDFGAPKQFKSIVVFPRGLDYFHRNNWAGRIRAEDGSLINDSPANNAAAHYLHNMLFLLGGDRETSATPQTVQAELYRANEIENFDTTMMRVTVAGGVELIFYATHCITAKLGPIARYEFEDAVVSYENESGSGYVARFRNGRVRRYSDPNLEREQKMLQSIEAAAHGGPVACGARTAMPHVLCVAAAQRSMPTITDFPASMIIREPIGETTMVSVNGLHAAMIQCYDQGILPAEHGGLDWAAPAQVVAVEPAGIVEASEPVFTEGDPASDNETAGPVHV